MKDEIRNVYDHMSTEDSWINLYELMGSGISIDEVIKDKGEPSPGYFARHYVELLDLGVDPERLFKLNEGWYLLRTDWPDGLKEVFEDYIDHGLERKVIDEWLEHYVDLKRLTGKSEPFKHAAAIPGDAIK